MPKESQTLFDKPNVEAELAQIILRREKVYEIKHEKVSSFQFTDKRGIYRTILRFILLKDAQRSHSTVFKRRPFQLLLCTTLPFFWVYIFSDFYELKSYLSAIRKNFLFYQSAMLHLKLEFAFKPQKVPKLIPFCKKMFTELREVL